MAGTRSLSGTWGLTYAEGGALTHPGAYTAPAFEGRRLMEARVPAPIHRVLMDAGLLEDPNVGMNSMRARWVEEAFWIYRREFDAPHEATDSRAWLVFDELALYATVWLNGEELGRHANAFRPARFDVTGKLRGGANLVVVLLETGVWATADLPSADYHGSPTYLKRAFHRAPQYQYGWDWNAHLVNVGIVGDVRLEWADVFRVDQLSAFAVPSADLSAATLTVRAHVEGLGGEPVRGTLRARVAETGESAEAAVEIPPGEGRCEVRVSMAKPELWWPRPHGEAHLYTIQVELEAEGERRTAALRTGVRRVEVDRSRHPVEGDHFILKVNNRPVFCKGGNWVPPDLLWAPVDEPRTRELVRLACEANFNLLRVWGGGRYVDRALGDACDEAGVLLWHDFIFACSKYPGDDPEFAAEVRREAAWNVRRLARHPSMVVWCGNNEIEWGDWHWGYDSRARTHPHYAIFHHDLPRIVREEAPHVFYWPSSPFSTDQREPNSPVTGDQHPWGVSIIQPGGADFWLYRKFVDRFPNEGGVTGCSPLATLRGFLPEGERSLLSPSWDHHDNPFACHGSKPGEIGRAYQTVRLWTGRDPLAMDWERYAKASALLQAEGLAEYVANYRRRMFSSASAVFWMYNDSWPVTHGWTIVDYHLRRKLAYHPVRRAFEPATVVVAEEGDSIAIFGVSELDKPPEAELRFGVFRLAGGFAMDETKRVTLAPNASTELARFPRAELERAGTKRAGAFAVLSREGAAPAQHRLFTERFGDLDFAPPEVRVSVEAGVATFESDAFAWGVCVDVEGDSAALDNCFDLLPGVPYRVPWPAGLGVPEVVMIGSRDVVGPAR